MSSIPGAAQALDIQNKLKKLGVHDIELYYDQTIQPHGMWAVCQVNKPSGSILLLRDTTIDTQPQIMWWCKDNEGRFRLPNEQDLSDAVITVKRAHKIWDKGGDWLADRLDEQDKARDEAHHKKQRQMVEDIAKPLKAAIRKELT